jgi:hypothetical protein
LLHKLLSKYNTFKWIFWSIPVFKTLWIARCSKLYSNKELSCNELCSHCIAQWLSSHTHHYYCWLRTIVVSLHMTIYRPIKHDIVFYRPIWVFNIARYRTISDIVRYRA